MLAGGQAGFFGHGLGAREFGAADIFYVSLFKSRTLFALHRWSRTSDAADARKRPDAVFWERLPRRVRKVFRNVSVHFRRFRSFCCLQVLSEKQSSFSFERDQDERVRPCFQELRHFVCKAGDGGIGIQPDPVDHCHAVGFQIVRGLGSQAGSEDIVAIDDGCPLASVSGDAIGKHFAPIKI